MGVGTRRRRGAVARRREWRRGCDANDFVDRVVKVWGEVEPGVTVVALVSGWHAQRNY